MSRTATTSRQRAKPAPSRTTRESDEIRTIRGLEAQTASLRTQLHLERQKREQAETELERAARSLEVYERTNGRIGGKALRRGGPVSRGSATAVLCANDWHVEGCVTKASVDGANEFNLDIARQRIARTWQKSLYLLDFVRKISDVRDLVLWLGGDLINGTIHEELEESNFLGPAEAVLFVQEQVAGGIDLLAKEAGVDRLTVVTSCGNHGRTTKRRRISTGYRHSWEWLAYHNLARHYASRPKVAFHVGPGYHAWQTIQGYDVRFHHGDAVRFAGGIGGVTIPLQKKIAQWNKRRTAKYDVLGHFHQYVDSWNYVISGSLIGYDAYALEIGAEFQPPTQTFLVIDRQYGKVLTAPIFCGDAA